MSTIVIPENGRILTYRGKKRGDTIIKVEGVRDLLANPLSDKQVLRSPLKQRGRFLVTMLVQKKGEEKPCYRSFYADYANIA